jgi:alpha-L-fucosidase
LGGNLLLNIGPTPEGEIREAHKERLLEMGAWLKTYGETIFGTRKSFMKPSDWGVAVEKGNKIYLHITNPAETENQIILTNFPYQINKASWFETGKSIEFTTGQNAGEIKLKLSDVKSDSIDQVIVLEVNI